MKTLNDYKIKLSLKELVYDDTKREVEILEEKMQNLKAKLTPLKNELCVYSENIKDLKDIIKHFERGGTSNFLYTNPFPMSADNDD